MKKFYDFIVEKESEDEHHASVIPLTGFSPISHMGHAKDLGSELKTLPGKKHIGISSKSELYTDKERGDILHKQWGDKDMKHHIVKSGGETIAKAFHSLPKNGKKHLHILVGHDRKDFAHGLKKSLDAGKIKEMGDHKWDSITIHHPKDSNRSHGMSGTNMRNAAEKGNVKEFHRHLGNMFTADEAKKHMQKFKSGIASGQIKVKRTGSSSVVKEYVFKAIFVTGGPGSGKDIVIREVITDSRFIELNTIQAFDYLMDKRKLSESSKDFRREAIRNRSPLIINGTADNFDRIDTIKEELEELGYATMMVYVDTANEISKQRNEGLKRMVSEAIREEKWHNSQINKVKFYNCFEDFNLFDNNDDLEVIEESITDVYDHINNFLDRNTMNDISIDWLARNKKLNINEKVTLLFKEPKNAAQNSKPVQKTNLRAKGVGKSGRLLFDNNAPVTQITRKAGKIDDVRDGDVASNSGYTFRTYEEKGENYGKEPTLKVNPKPKEPNFQQDKEKIKARKNRFTDSPTQNQRMRNSSGIGPEFDTRQQGTVYPMSGLGDVSYREHVENISDKYIQEGAAAGPRKEFSQFRVETVKEAIDDPGATDMGVGGVLGGASNKEPLITPFDKFAASGITIKKKKKQEK